MEECVAVFEACRAIERIFDDEDPVFMAILQAYFDESGKLENTEFVSFGGIVGWVSDMESLSRRWKATLKDNGLAYVRMTEAMNFRNEFAGWRHRQEERDTLLEQLANMTRQYCTSLVAGLRSNAEVFKLSADRKKELKNPQYVGFEACVREIMSVKGYGKYLIHLNCDSSEQYAHECLKLYHRLRKNDQEVRNRCIALTFGEDQHFPPLQAADIYSYCRGINATEKATGIISELLEIFDKDASQRVFGYQGRTPLGSGGFVK